MNYYMPTRLFTGDDCISQHSDALRALGDSCIIITDRIAAKASGALDDVCAALDSCAIAHVAWDGVSENPPVSACIEAGRLAAERGATFVLGIGGGSSLDAAKAISVFAANPDLDEAGFYALAWDRSPLPIALVGTTAGTGSEVTKVSVLTDAAHRKHSIHDDRLYATVAFGDSRHTHSCPASVTLSCGVDIIAHATESYFSHKADEVSRAFAVRAIRLSSAPLAAAAAGEELDVEQRRALYEASILGGLAINTTGTCFPHNVGYYLTENYSVPHGFASAIFLPAMLTRVRDYDAPYAAAFYDEIGSDEETFVRLIEGCLPKRDIAMTDDEVVAALPRWENNGSVKNTRAAISVEAIHEILLSLFVR
ncbi:MAG: iron-containing alcohol dehydrogenase [Atopobiaceae bacterium]|nr:iron-containing alcohol dehydrogenase [Atopobiaceae bacterium]MBR3313397.1 iron-containing alcohol dehydrogenase [Atopobiaceae bacterium]